MIFWVVVSLLTKAIGFHLGFIRTITVYVILVYRVRK